MDSTRRLTDALKQQFQWVPMLITDRQHSSPGQKRRAALYAAMHFCFILVLACHMLSYVMSWIVAFLLQCVAQVFAVLYFAHVEEYAEKMSNAMELEKTVNPFIVGQISIRCFAIFHFFLMRGWLLAAFGVIELIYDYWYTRKRGALLIDATTVWKEIDAIRLDARVRTVYQFVVVLFAIANLVMGLLSE